MGDIYRNSRSVIIWLGKSDSDTEEAISLLTKFGNAVKNLQVDMWSWKDFTFNDPLFYDHVGLEPFQMSQWEIILRFFARRWFKRLWVLQEVVLGKPTNFIIGHHALEFEAVSLTVKFLFMSWWVPSLSSLPLHQASEDSHSRLAASGDNRPLLMYWAFVLEDCKEDGPENKDNTQLKLLHGARDSY